MRFAALLVYSPDGTSDASRASTKVVRDIKDCLPAYMARIGVRFEEAFRAGRFEGFLGPNVLLVPAPRSAPFKTRDAAWPARQICEVLASHHLCAHVVPLLARHTPVQKSALFRRGAERPSPERHAETIRCADLLVEPPVRITVVDDVVTRGSTFLGCARVLAARFPGTDVRALAVVRTMSKQEISSMLDPVEGTISVKGGTLRREP